MSSNRVIATTSSHRRRTRRPVAANSQPHGIMDIDLTRAGAVPKIVEIGVAQFKVVEITAREGSQADVRRDEVDDDDLTEKAVQEAGEFSAVSMGIRPVDKKGSRFAARQRPRAWVHLDEF